MKLSFNKQPVPETNQLSLFKNDFKIGDWAWFLHYDGVYFGRVESLSKTYSGSDEYIVTCYNGKSFSVTKDELNPAMQVPISFESVKAGYTLTIEFSTSSVEYIVKVDEILSSNDDDGNVYVSLKDSIALHLHKNQIIHKLVKA